MKALLIHIFFCCFICQVNAQAPTVYKQVERGFTYSFSSEKFKKFPKIVYVDPLSDADLADLHRTMIIFTVDDTYFALMSQKEIIEFLTNLPQGPLKIGASFESSENAPTYYLNAFIPPVKADHPDGTCLSGDCTNGTGYLRYKNYDYYRGVFKNNIPVEGDFYNSATATRTKIPDPALSDTTYKHYLSDLTTVDGKGDWKFKRLYTSDKSATPDIYYESGRKYRGELDGLVPHGKGMITYTKMKVVDPNISTQILAPLILEGEFEKGKFIKATRMRTDAYTGMFIDGNISAGVSRMEYFYRVTNPTLKSWGYRNAQNDYVPEERTIFKLNEGGFCYNGQFTGSGIYYCNQYAYSAIYGGEIHIKSIKDGFVNDSVELVLPHLNYRKKFTVQEGYRKFIRLDLLEDYIEIYYTTGKMPPGNWNTFVGEYVKKEPDTRTYTSSEVLAALAMEYKIPINVKYGNTAKIIGEGGVLSDNYLSTGITFGDYLDAGESLMLLVLSYNGAAIEVSNKNGVCAPEIIIPKEAGTGISLQLHNCDWSQMDDYRIYVPFKINCFQPSTEMYYILYKISNK